MNITNNILYSDLVNTFSNIEGNELDPDAVYYSLIAELGDQSQFSDNLVRTIAEIGRDAAEELLTGEPRQEGYSEEAVLFESEQDLYATWLGRLGSRISAVAKGTKNAFQYVGRKDKYIHDTTKGTSKGTKKLMERSKKYGFGSRFKQGYEGHMMDVHKSRKNRVKELNEEAEKALAADRLDKAKKKAAAELQKKFDTQGHRDGFTNRFRDNKGGFLGMGKKGEGFGKWAKNNKANAAALGAAGAATAVGGYLAYKKLKKYNQEKKAKQIEAAHQRALPAPSNR